MGRRRKRWQRYLRKTECGVRKIKRERESERKSVCVCVCVRERERKWARERKRKSVGFKTRWMDVMSKILVISTITFNAANKYLAYFRTCAQSLNWLKSARHLQMRPTLRMKIFGHREAFASNKNKCSKASLVFLLLLFVTTLNSLNYLHISFH